MIVRAEIRTSTNNSNNSNTNKSRDRNTKNEGSESQGLKAHTAHCIILIGKSGGNE